MKILNSNKKWEHSQILLLNNLSEAIFQISDRQLFHNYLLLHFVQICRYKNRLTIFWRRSLGGQLSGVNASILALGMKGLIKTDPDNKGSRLSLSVDPDDDLVKGVIGDNPFLDL